MGLKRSNVLTRAFGLVLVIVVLRADPKLYLPDRPDQDAQSSSRSRSRLMPEFGQHHRPEALIESSAGRNSRQQRGGQISRHVSELSIARSVPDRNGVRIVRVVALAPERERRSRGQACIEQYLPPRRHAGDAREEALWMRSDVLGLAEDGVVLVDRNEADLPQQGAIISLELMCVLDDQDLSFVRCISAGRNAHARKSSGSGCVNNGDCCQPGISGTDEGRRGDRIENDDRAISATSPCEHTFGEQFGEQIQRNPGKLRSTKPSKHGLHHLSGTPSLRLGAGRSQVQILSPR